MSKTHTSMLIGTFRLFYQPTFDDHAPMQRLAERFDGQQHSYMQWVLLLRFERGER